MCRASRFREGFQLEERRRPTKPKASSPKVAARMRAVRVANTVPESIVRRVVHSMGFRYRVCTKSLPGRPDLANITRGWCIFVHGCFWHGHVCRRGRRPKVNVPFWADKVVSNRARDAAVEEELRQRGFRVLVVWQCELDDPRHLRRRLARFLEATRKGGDAVT